MKWRPATSSVRSVPGPVMWTSSRPSIHSASRCVSSEARFQAATGSSRSREAGAVVEVLVGGEAHRRARGVGVGREDRHAQRCSPAAARSIIASISGAIAFCAPRLPRRARRRRARACSRRPSAGSGRRPRSAIQRCVGEIQSICSSRGALEEGRGERRRARARRSGARRRRARARRRRAPAARRRPAPSIAQRVALADLRSSARPGSSPGSSTLGSLIARLLVLASGARTRPPVAIAISSACTRESSVELRVEGAGQHARPRGPRPDGPPTRRAPRRRRRASSIHGARMKTARSGSGPMPSISQVGLEALQLAAEGVAAGARVDQAEVLAVADDHPRAGAEDRPPARGELADRLGRGRRARSPSLIVVLSPPGMTSASSPSRSRGSAHLDRPRRRARRASARGRRSRPGWRGRRSAAGARRTRAGTTSRAAAAARPRPRAGRCRRRASARRGPSRRRAAARGP